MSLGALCWGTPWYGPYGELMYLHIKKAILGQAHGGGNLSCACSAASTVFVHKFQIENYESMQPNSMKLILAMVYLTFNPFYSIFGIL